MTSTTTTTTETVTATEYVCIVESWGDGGDITEAQADTLCTIATDWLSKNEGEALSITMRMPDRGEVCGTFRARYGNPTSGWAIGSGDSDEEQTVRELTDAAWEYTLENSESVFAA